ncbi:MAG: UDP-3-O-(3-hydroxymyristoyl)glucosamine N-acyltransferase [Armatimonadetes bacterium]|nr:UDP-3-O-(3-hydroxymyristoyl)glucosamine N-acyltransferase [Armatimonadota bacterium]
METNSPIWTLGEIAQWIGGKLNGPSDLKISGVCPASDARAGAITFAAEDSFLDQAIQAGVTAVIVKPGADTRGIPSIEVTNPKQAFGYLLSKLSRPIPFHHGVHTMASVDPGAEIDPTASVGPFAVIERGAVIGKNARIYPFAYIGESCEVGDDAVIYPHAVLMQDVTIGKRSIVHPGAIIGADGFGFVWDGSRHVKIPHVGGVSIGDDSEVGALTAIDRGTMSDTSVGDDTKIDNLVQLAHNGRVGDHTVIAGQCGFPGSVTIGSRVQMGGGVGLNAGVTIGDDVILGGWTGATKDVLEPGVYFGTPALPVREALRIMNATTKLPELMNKLRELEKRIQELEK